MVYQKQLLEEWAYKPLYEIIHTYIVLKYIDYYDRFTLFTN